jgi:acyl carrier protein
MSPQAQVLERLTAILAEILVLNPEDIRPESRLVDDLDADSITFLELTYRIREDFGLQVPEAKVNEEALNRPLIQGMEMVQQAIGGTTLFEFMNAEASRGGVVDAAQIDRIDALLAERDPSILPTLRGLIDDAYEDPDGCIAVASLLGPLRANGGHPLLSALCASDPSIAAKLDHMEQIAAEEAAANAPAAAVDLFSIWRRLGGTERARQRSQQLTVGQLAAMMRSPLPVGSQPEDPVSALRLRDLFRFITVDSYVRYVIYLQDAQERIQAAGGAEAMNAEVTARLRAQA